MCVCVSCIVMDCCGERICVHALQCVAECCSVLQSVAVYCEHILDNVRSVRAYVFVCVCVRVGVPTCVCACACASCVCMHAFRYAYASVVVSVSLSVSLYVL